MGFSGHVMPKDMPPPHDLDAEALLRRLTRELKQTAEHVAPRFLEQMPDAYFRDTDPDTVRAHLSAVIAARASGIPPQLILKDEGQQTWTFVHEQSYRGLLSGLVEQLPRDRPLVSAKVHTAADGQLVLDVFHFGEASRFNPEDPTHVAKLEATLAYAQGLGEVDTQRELRNYIAQCSADFVRAGSPLRLYETWRLTKQVRATEQIACGLYSQATQDLMRISVVATDADTRALFERLVRHIGRNGFDITRAFLDVVRTDDGTPLSSIGFVVRDPERRLKNEDAPTWKTLRAAIKRLRWVDEQTLARIEANSQLGLQRSEILVALTRLVHPLLAQDNPFAFTRDRLYDLLDRYPDVGMAVADAFVGRFAPPSRGDPDGLPVPEILARIENRVDTETARRFFRTLCTAVERVTRTNLHAQNRLGLAFMVNPALFDNAERERPFGVCFVHADSMDGFHVRFQDVARGGVRAVRPRGPEQYLRESERLFEEVYDLAYAQQLKNKDIPEGGSKAVVLLAPGADVEPGVKAFIDGLLDLLSVDESSDRLYLGPDENISPSLIEWVVARAETRGYPEPNAFMSSKPGAGINHKEFGVTSEGVTVFLEEALKAAGIDPRAQSFTVKLTGGPDGDVAGNELRILHREFGRRAKVVGIADGSGAGWDPDGLDFDELLRLVDAESPIAAFNRKRLGPRGQVLGLDDEGGLQRRNQLPFDVEADAFIPAGGRPQTIRADNWTRFLKHGRPSSRVIVEGANLFITPEARLRLSEAGVLVVKDSAANKCGVICSSYEVAASLLLHPDEFLAIKPQFVVEVLDRLRSLARQEARLLLKEPHRDPSVLLPERAVAISRAILRVSDAVAKALAGRSEEGRRPFVHLIREHLPPSLIEMAGARIDALPQAYRDRIMAARLGAAAVYREGIDYWAAVSDAQLGATCLAYHAHQLEAEALATEVIRSNLSSAERIATMLQKGGARAAMALNQQETGDLEPDA